MKRHRLWLCLSLVLLPQGLASGEGLATNPVVVELFTSEGCSSCPPADKILVALSKSHTAGEIIVISEHVDYWDYLGWKDPFSKPEYTNRQQEYARSLKQSGVYTPEMVIDGVQGFNGADAQAASRAVSGAVKRPKTHLNVSANFDSEKKCVRVKIESLPRQMNRGERLVVFVTEDNLAVKVKAGENTGKALAHTGVARVLKTFDQVPKEELVIAVGSSVKPTELKVIALVQNSPDMSITAAGICRVK